MLIRMFEPMGEYSEEDKRPVSWGMRGFFLLLALAGVACLCVEKFPDNLWGVPFLAFGWFAIRGK
jgi:hypothetical protein